MSCKLQNFIVVEVIGPTCSKLEQLVKDQTNMIELLKAKLNLV